MDFHTIVYAILGGLVPAVIWLLFWLREDVRHPEPKYRIGLSFVAGMVAVLVVLPIETSTYTLLIARPPVLFTFWAFSEEVLKLIACFIVALRMRDTDEPIDAVIYMLTTALGFAAMENILFLLNPLQDGNIVQTILTGNLRFVGASLLHVISSGTIGVFIALSFYKTWIQKQIYLIFGLIGAVVLHTVFNLFIIRESSQTALITFGVVWIGIIVLIVFFEKVKTIYPVGPKKSNK